MAEDINLYNTLFPDDDEQDVGMFVINEMYDHLNYDKISNYVDITGYNSSTLHNDKNNLSIIHVNIRCLPTNLHHLEVLLASFTNLPDIIVLTETWMTPNNKDSINLPGYNQYSVVRDQRARGGVSVFTKQCIESKLMDKFSFITIEIEICSVSITINDKSYVISAIYRPRSKHENVDEFSRELNKLLNSSALKRSNTILIGDLNINLLDHVIHRPTNDFLNMLQTFNYLPLITRPTRFPEGNQNASPSLLDHIYVNFSRPLVAGILHHKITDHLPIFVHISLPCKTTRCYTKTFRDFNDHNKAMFTRSLSNVFWEEILVHDNIDSNFNAFFEKFEALYNTHFPIKSKRITEKKINNPWVTTGILTSIKTKNRLFKEMKLGLISSEQFNLFRNRFITIIRIAKRRYYQHLFSSFKNNTKKLWQAVNKLTKNSTIKVGKTTIVKDNRILSNPDLIANEFNQYFSSIATELEAKLPPSPTDPMSYLTENHVNPMQNPNVSLSNILHVLRSLKSKPCRTNDFSTIIIKENAHLIATPILHLFNQSINQGIFPNRLKIANVVPLYKKGDKSDMGNYRPIALLNIFSKIFEKAMKKYLVDFISENNILSKFQFGFQKGISTQCALTKFSEIIHNTIDSSHHALSIFIDFSKAFDTVPHNLLLMKLEHYGIRNNLLDWFTSYLTNRTQYTIFENNSSTSLENKLGVPQGSVLGPILFLLFINDLPNISHIIKTILFADDATLTVTGKDVSRLFEVANAELHKFQQWCLANRLTINVLKTMYMLFSKSKINETRPIVIKSGFSYEIIKRVNNTKFLGIYFDDKMTFKSHVIHLSQRLSRTAALLYQVKDLMPEFVLKKMYYAHVQSLLCYCNLIWCNTNKTDLNPIALLQKRIIRIITNSNILAHTQPLFQQSKILNIDNLRKLSLASYAYKNRDKFNNLIAQHNYQTRRRNQLRPIRHRTSQFEKSFVYQAPIIWNDLITNHQQIADSPSIKSFKASYKRYLLTVDD